MKKLLILMVMLILGVTLLMSQTIAEYTFSTTADGTLEDMTGSTDMLVAGTYYDDTASALFAMPFTFALGTGAYTQFSANSNGQMQLGSTAISGGAASPALNIPRLAPISGDNAIRATGRLHYTVVGEAPNRKLVVEWLDLRVNYSSAAETGTYCRMQAWLYESTNNIKFVYGTMWNMSTSAQARGVYVSTSNIAGSVGNVTDILNTMTWTNNGTSVVTTSFPASSAMANLNSAAEGERRVFHINYPVYTTPPNAAVLVAPADNGWTFTGQPLQWVSGGGGATSYDVYFGTTNPPAFVQNQGATSYAPTLAAGTTYFWQIDAVNEHGTTPGTVWSFQTPTATQVAESFEATTFPPAGWANPGTWSRSTSYFKHGVASAYKYGSASTQYVLSTPRVTIVEGSTLNLWTLCSATTGTLQVVYSPDRVTWTQVGANITHAATYTMYNSVIDLSSLAGNNYYLGIRTGLQAVSFYIDAIFGPEITPEAPGPVTLTAPADLAINVNEYTAFTWTAPTTGGVPTGYRVYVDTVNPPLTQVADVTGLTYTMTTPLAYNTTYYWTVEAYNGNGSGPQAAVRSYTTRANPVISTFPWLENFGSTGAVFPPLNWNRLTGLYPTETPTATTGGWAQDDFGNVVTAPPNYSGRINIWSTTTKHWLVTPPIAIPADGYELKFDLAYTTYSGTVQPPAGTQADDKFIVFIADNPNMVNPTILREWNNTGSPYVYDNISPSGEVVGFDLTGYSGTKYIAFYGESTVSGGDNNVYVDNVLVREIPEAPVFFMVPTSWDFGTRVINTPATKQFTITNLGAGVLDIQTISISGSYYTLTVNPAPVSLTANQSTSFTVQYLPTAAGTHNGTVTITDGRAVTEVPLTASCIDPTIYDADLPYTQGFESWPPVGWDLTGGTHSFTQLLSGTNNWARANFWSQSAGSTDIMTTPPINITSPVRLNFLWSHQYSTSYPTDALTVQISTNYTNWTNLLNLTGPTDFNSNDGAGTTTPGTGVARQITIPAEYVGAPFWIRFFGYSGYGPDLFIDNVNLELVPEQPIFGYSPASVNFGMVAVSHQSTWRNVTVTNNGGSILELETTDLSLTGTDAAMFEFDASNLPAALAAGQSVIIPIRFTPASLGAKTATFSMVYDAVTYDVALTGEGSLPMVYMTNGSTTMVAGESWNFYDSGGPAAPYQNSENYTYTFYPPTGAIVTAEFISFSTEAGYDYLYIYDGSSITDPLLGQYDNSDVIPNIESTHASGALTFRFTSDSSVTYPGWEAVLTSYTPVAERPDAPILVAPADLATNLPVGGIQFSWTRGIGGGNPSGYWFSMADDPERLFSEEDSFMAELTGTAITPVYAYAYLTTYYWAVYAYNAFGDSEISDIYSFTTRDVPSGITTFPWLEDFETVTVPALPDGWTIINNDGSTTTWISTVSQNHTVGGSKSVYHPYNGSNDENGYLVTPAVTVPVGLNMVMSWWNYNAYPSWYGYNGLLVSTSPTGPWTELWTTAAVAAAWVQNSANISAYGGQTVYFAFNYQGLDAHDWFVDDVSIFELVSDVTPPTISYVPVLNTPRDDTPYLVYADIVDDATWNNPIDGANMYYSVNGGAYNMVPMTLDRDGYYAFIPAQMLDSEIDYYMEAWDSEDNMATTPVHTFYVENPTWIWYDQGGTIFIGYTTYDFGPTVLFENPFFGTGIPMVLNATDGMSYYGNTANLHIYSYDGVDIVDLITPIPVTFGAQTYEVFSLTSYNIQITTPYFLIAYEDIPMGNYILFDETFDYGTSYVKLLGELYTLSRAGSWAIGVNVTNGTSLALDAPVVTISQTAGAVELSWAAITGASSYLVFASDDAYAADPWTLLATTDLLTYTYTGTEAYKFFKVVASSEAPVVRTTLNTAQRFAPLTLSDSAARSLKAIKAPVTGLRK